MTSTPKYTTVLVAFVVEAETKKEAADYLYDVGLTEQANRLARVDSWWIAEDSSPPVVGGNEAAVFVPDREYRGYERMTTKQARRILEEIT